MAKMAVPNMLQNGHNPHRQRGAREEREEQPCWQPGRAGGDGGVSNEGVKLSLAKWWAWGFLVFVCVSCHPTPL